MKEGKDGQENDDFKWRGCRARKEGKQNGIIPGWLQSEKIAAYVFL